MERLERLLLIGFENSLSLTMRRSLIESDESVDSIFRRLGKEQRKEDVMDSLKWLEKPGCKILCYGENGFPDYGNIEQHLPYFLFYKGQKPYEGPRLTVVGTRYPTEAALQRAFCLGLEAQVNRIAVVTGMASGIDQASVRGSLSAKFVENVKCRTIGVLGCGLEVDYPAMSLPLRERIIESGGTLISQFAPCTPGYKQNFPNRNVTMAALGDACVVVQAPAKSGSLITAEMSLELGKDVIVCREGLEERSVCAGTRKLSEEGAPVITSLSDVFEVDFRVLRTDKLIKPFARYGEYNYTVLRR